MSVVFVISIFLGNCNTRIAIYFRSLCAHPQTVPVEEEELGVSEAVSSSESFSLGLEARKAIVWRIGHKPRPFIFLVILSNGDKHV